MPSGTGTPPTARPRPPPAAAPQQINLAGYRSGHRLRLDPAAAKAAAIRYLHAAHLSGTVAATTTTVTVTVTHTTRTQLLGLIGIDTLTETATVTATPLHGVTGPIP